jgi:hypothetical protein
MMRLFANRLPSSAKCDLRLQGLRPDRLCSVAFESAGQDVPGAVERSNKVKNDLFPLFQTTRVNLSIPERGY